MLTLPKRQNENTKSRRTEKQYSNFGQQNKQGRPSPRKGPSHTKTGKPKGEAGSQQANGQNPIYPQGTGHGKTPEEYERPLPKTEKPDGFEEAHGHKALDCHKGQGGGDQKKSQLDVPGSRKLDLTRGPEIDHESIQQNQAAPRPTGEGGHHREQIKSSFEKEGATLLNENFRQP